MSMRNLRYNILLSTQGFDFLKSNSFAPMKVVQTTPMLIGSEDNFIMSHIESPMVVRLI